MNSLYFGYLLEPVLETWQIRAIPFDENPLYVSKSYFERLKREKKMSSPKKETLISRPHNLQ
jgi:hypothetical protein